MYFFVDEQDKYIIKNNITGLNQKTINGMKEKFTLLIENYSSRDGDYIINDTSMLKNV